MSQNPYVMAGRQLESVVAYLAIHGFSDRVRVECKAKRANLLLQELHHTVMQARDFVVPHTSFRGPDSVRSHETKLFAEQVLLGIPIDLDLPHPVETEVYIALDKVAGYQYVLALHGFFVSGGVTQDLHYSDDIVAFGPALISAVRLQKSQDIIPRVALSQELAKWIVKVHSRHDPIIWSGLERLLLVDNHGVLFVNYLAQSDPACEDTPDETYVRMHADGIRKMAGKAKKPTPQVAWLVGYHNWFCRQYDSLPGSLRITGLPEAAADHFPEPSRFSECIARYRGKDRGQ